METSRQKKDKSSSRKPGPSKETTADEQRDITLHDPEEQAWSTSKATPTGAPPKDITLDDPEEQAWSTSKYTTQAADHDDDAVDEDDDDETSDPSDHDDNEENNLPPPKPPTFAPFYTLIVDPRTNSHAHPTVHYIFADDDPDLLTDALLHSAEENTRASVPTGAAKSSTAEERIVIIDLSPNGEEILSATSLSPEWQSLKTSLSPAPSWQGGGGGGGGGDAAEGGGTGKVQMLRVWGEEARGLKVGKGVGLGIAGQAGRRDVGELMGRFEGGLRGLEGVLGSVEGVDGEEDGLGEGKEDGEGEGDEEED